MAENCANISDFYNGTNILITGATGFLGKVLLEKLLRSCKSIRTIYVLVRQKKNVDPQQRFDILLRECPLFNVLKETNPNFFEKVKVLEGDITQENCGLSNEIRSLIQREVNIIFHLAATVRFDGDLQQTIMYNVFGTEQIIQLSNEVHQLKSFVYVSTAYSNADKHHVEEVIYDTEFEPETVINYIQTLPLHIIKKITPDLIGGHPNVYTFSKSLAERIVSDNSNNIPAVIVRPSIVTASWKEPFPGWVDNISGITGIMMECARGTIKSIVCKEELLMDLIPVDIVANTLITAAWHTEACRSNTIRVYNCTSSQINGISWKNFGELTTQYALEYPSKYVSGYPGFTYRSNRLMHWICHALFHYMLACILDIFLYCTKRKPIMLRICRQITRAAKNGEFFSLHEWNFRTTTIKSLIEVVKNSEDGKNFNVDLSKENGFQWDPYVKNYLLGIRQHILKDDLSSLDGAKTKLNRLYWTNKVIQLLSTYVFLKLALCKDFVVKTMAIFLDK